MTKQQVYKLVSESKSNHMVMDQYGYPTGKILTHSELTVRAMSGTKSEINEMAKLADSLNN